MNATGSDEAAVVEFTGKVQRMAKVHHFGLMDRPGINSKPEQYPEHILLGISGLDRVCIEEGIINFVNKSH